MQEALNTLDRQQLTKLAQEATELAEWTTVRDFANQMYANKAASIEIETYSEYNDEGGYNNYIENITAYGKDGEELEFDQSLPFFSSQSWKHIEEIYKECEDEDMLTKLKDVYLRDDETWILLDDLPAEDATYDLTVIPTISVLSQIS